MAHVSGVFMTVSHLATGLCPSVACASNSDAGSTPAASHDTFARHGSIAALMSAAHQQMPDIAWAAYAAGELKCLLGQGDDKVVWPAHIAAEDFDTFCNHLQLHC
ncbi:protein of unknown function [Pseudomonas syringae pv. tomato str. DC3000]|uniref:Uncharacterized protein n=5 Tax=Pseudomonas syringae group TaxID=136849 RepID=Q882D0_PSESM|nr:protein of unknown function [Pseudomonas syringae pv. tomato str. DC3000]MBW8019788.1 hypothetical protein [Pseudomonas syringae pv. tomato]